MTRSDVFLGIDLGGTDIKAAVLSPDGQILWNRHISTGAAEGREAVVVRLTDLIRDASRDVAPNTLRGAGVAIPGVLDMRTGVVELLTNFTRDWNGFPLRDDLQTRSKMPVFLLNDVRAATVAEQMWGAGRGYRHFICIAIGTGIGGGLVLDGRLYLGSRGAAGEIGHQTVVPDGPRCNCGNRGCVEALAAGCALARDARLAIEAGDTELERVTGSAEPTPHQVAVAAEGGNVTARELFTRAGQYVGQSLANLVCTLNPEAVVVGGGIALAGELLLGPIREEIARRTIVFSPKRGGVAVLQSPLGGQAGAMGAAAWAMAQVDAEGTP